MQKLIQNNILTILACGGNSSRMGRDKSLIIYHELPQRYHLIQLTKELNLKTALSLNDKQQEVQFPFMVVRDQEKYKNKGPLTALLSVSENMHADYYLLLGCDYPMLTIKDIERLIENCSSENQAICYGNRNNPEPLLCLYSTSLIEVIKKNLSKVNSLSSILKESNVHYIQLPSHLKSIDTPNESHEYKQQCKPGVQNLF